MRGHLGQSLWLREVHGREEGNAPPVDLTLEKHAGQIIRMLIRDGLVSAVHDVSDGGIAVALAEMAMAGGLGAEVKAREGFSLASWWFGEDQGRYLISVPDVDALNETLARGTASADMASVGFFRLGTVTGNRLFGISLEKLRRTHLSFFHEWMEG